MQKEMRKRGRKRVFIESTSSGSKAALPSQLRIEVDPELSFNWLSLNLIGPYFTFNITLINCTALEIV